MRRSVCALPVYRILAAAILTALPFLVTGFFHLDGFLDCCDAILSRRDLHTRQKILKDSRVGAFAVVCAILLFLFSFAALADCDFSYIWRALLLVPVVTRCMAGVAVESFAPMKTSQYAGTFAAGKNEAAAEHSARHVPCRHAGGVRVPVFAAQLRAGRCVGGARDHSCLPSARKHLGGMSGDIAGFSITLGERPPFSFWQSFKEERIWFC